jgi:hypothetical protein
MPVAGDLGLGRIDRRRPGELDEPKVGREGDRPDLALVPTRAFGLFRRREARRRFGHARVDDDRPVPGPQLHPQSAVGVEPRGQRRADRRGEPARRQREPEHFFPRLPRRAERHEGLKTRRHRVLETPGDLEVDPVLDRCRRPRRARLAEPEGALCIPARPRDPLAVEHELDEAGLVRDPQSRRHRAPDEASFDGVRAGREAHPRSALPVADRRPDAIDPHVLGPHRPPATRQRNLGRPCDEHALPEPPAPGVEVELEASGPDAGARPLALEEGTGLVFVAPQHPSDPGRERLGDVFPREGLGGRRRDHQPTHRRRHGPENAESHRISLPKLCVGQSPTATGSHESLV